MNTASDWRRNLETSCRFGTATWAANCSLRALEGGAAASGQESSGIEQGAAADFVVLSDDDPMLAGHGDDSRLDALVFSGYPLPVERVMVNGEWRVIDAMHVARDHARAAYAEAIATLGSKQ